MRPGEMFFFCYRAMRNMRRLRRGIRDAITHRILVITKYPIILYVPTMWRHSRLVFCLSLRDFSWRACSRVRLLMRPLLVLLGASV